MSIEEYEYLMSCIHSIRRNTRHLKHELNYLFLHAAKPDTHDEYSEKLVNAMRILDEALEDIQLDLLSK